jgi:hypothetical protein
MLSSVAKPEPEKVVESAPESVFTLLKQTASSTPQKTSEKVISADTPSNISDVQPEPKAAEVSVVETKVIETDISNIRVTEDSSETVPAAGNAEETEQSDSSKLKKKKKKGSYLDL